MGKRLDEKVKKDSWYIKKIGKVAKQIHEYLKKANRGYKHLLIHSCELDFSMCGNGDLGPAHGVSMPQELQEFYSGRRGC